MRSTPFRRILTLPPLTLLALLLFPLLVGSAFAQHSYPKPQIASAVGQPAPAFTLKDQDGKPFHLAALKGQPVLLYFYRGYW